MDELVPFGSRGMEVAARIQRAMAWAVFLELLGEDRFRRVVEEAAGSPKNMHGLKTQEWYFKKTWPIMWQFVNERYTAIVKEESRRNQIEDDRRMEAELYSDLASLMAAAFGMTGSDNQERLVQWIRFHGIPAVAPEKEYITLRGCSPAETYPYADSFRCVVLSNMPWIPESFDIFRFLEGAKARYKKVFLYLWALFGEEIRRDHTEVRTERKANTQRAGYVDVDSRKVLSLFKREEGESRGRGARIPIDPEYGLLLAAVRAEIADRVSEGDLELQNFIPDLHVPQIAGDILLREIQSEGLSARNESRFFSSQAQWLIDVCGQFLNGTLPWKGRVDERVRRQMEAGAIENWEILLEFEKNAERWYLAYQGNQAR